MYEFSCNTIAQYKIGAWLAAQGVTDEDIVTVTILDDNTVQITCMSGFSLTLRWSGDHADIIKEA